MNISRRKVSVYILMLSIFFLADYYISGGFDALSYDMAYFIEMYLESIGYSYYSIDAFVFIVIPVYLAFVAIMGDLGIQQIVRLGTIANIQRARNLTLFWLTAVFMAIHFLIGLAAPLICLGNPIFEEFMLLYCIQEVLIWICLFFLGAICKLLRIFTRSGLLAALIVYVILAIYYLMKNVVHFMINDLAYITPYYLGEDTANIFVVLMQLVSGVAIAIIIQYLLGSKEEFYALSIRKI